ncbi:galactose-1-phosphate uridylyltransferase [candidate division CSSED10-310 bacterium]|uniref:Galactose-1-phosphate uridylyltransferase n=1 Tax=candidate division CSSED10-310 bacterium TaxID=2855610 RepID=A0ABV6YUS8_UNCC1
MKDRDSMPEFRKDPVIGRWVIIAAERAERPSDFGKAEYQVNRGFCPFCEGNEQSTPPEILAFRKSGTAANTPGWKLRVVPNKFPALQIEGDLNRRGIGIYDQMNGIGAHEVIIETPTHGQTLIDLSPPQFEDVLLSFQLRMADLKKDTRFLYVIAFKNHGRAAGVSLEHSHSQLIALPIIPKRVAEEIRGADNHFRMKERCIFCDIIRQELETDVRIIEQNDSFIAISPFASRFPFEIWLLPKKHESHFEQISRENLTALSKILRNLLLRMNKVLDEPPYNFLIHTSPFNEEKKLSYHWHIEIIPKLSRVAGFEWGTGFYINPTSPEQATQFLKEVVLEQKAAEILPVDSP